MTDLTLSDLFPAGSIPFHAVSGVCRDRGIHSLWIPRIDDMARHAASAGLAAAGCSSVHANFTRVRVSRDWPSSGSITLDRADGARFRLYMTPRTHSFRVRRIDA